MSAVDEQLYNTVINHTQRLEAMDVTIKELAERVEALEGKKPAPDLEALIDKYILWVGSNPREALRDFAKELGVE